MSNVIELNLINQSNSNKNQSFVIFQKNIGSSYDESVVAWTVIENLRVGSSHLIRYSHELGVSAGDSYGNFTFPIGAENGQRFSMKRQPSGDVLVEDGQSASPNDIEVFNALPKGAIDANCFRSMRIVAKKTLLAPGQKAAFQFRPTIYIAALSQVVEGQILDFTSISHISTEISLLGIESADIIISGGGKSSSATEFTFTLDNIS